MNNFLKTAVEALAAPLLAAISAWILNHFYAGRFTRNIETSERLFKIMNTWLDIQDKVEVLQDSKAKKAASDLLDILWETLVEDLQREMHLPDRTKGVITRLQRVLLLDALKATSTRIWAFLAYSCLFVSSLLLIGLWRRSMPLEAQFSVLMVLTPLSLGALAWYVAYRRS